jgi:streptomycin 6-kinase
MELLEPSGDPTIEYMRAPNHSEDLLNEHNEERLMYYIKKWELEIQAPPFSTKTSILQTCSYKGKKAMLKLPMVEEERRGSLLMEWWDGIGAAAVLCSTQDAILLARIENKIDLSLTALVHQDHDDQATRIMCDTAQVLHSQRVDTRPPLVTLEEWFQPFAAAGTQTNELLLYSAQVANRLLQHQVEKCVLHGDLHHQNILYADDGGWKAIDPKGLYGDRAFDFANMLCNPTLEIALTTGRLAKQVDIICQQTGISMARMLDWTVAWAGLSTYWLAEDGEDIALALQFVELAARLRNEYLTQ